MYKPLVWLEEGLDPAPVNKLAQACAALTCVRSENELKSSVASASAVILHVSYSKLRDRQITVIGLRRMPILWLCAEPRTPMELESGYSLDGILYPSMTGREIEWALKWGTRAFQERRRWLEEKEQLLQRLEERKWVDQAKGILCEIKGISESEAYDFLRKQAMNERKRIGEVAASIVKVYQLIHG
ncbi:ANTAR domain-containing response regulator [Cohnella faecalis]|uniref:ANTAR domain-containing protein n=1 Tax=Cohnella faecalis TaxID=2315694 RepID=A0A398CQU7_9BACL|nr:ANTAR domain-containing protein [Cohnella faecalis]RIE02197.1 ANTAR domain-containing protein [Cohnella faecalis]